MKSLGGVKYYYDDDDPIWIFSSTQAIIAYNLVNFYIDFFSYVIKEKVLPQFEDSFSKNAILTLLKSLEGTFFKFNNVDKNSDNGVDKNEMSFVEYNKATVKDPLKKVSEDRKQSVSEFKAQLNSINGLKIFLSVGDFPDSLKGFFFPVLENLLLSVCFKNFVLEHLSTLRFMSKVGCTPNFEFSSADPRFNTYFSDVASWCLSPEVDNLFNEFISLYPYHKMRKGKNNSNKKRKRGVGSFYWFFNDTLLVGVMERVVAGKVDLSSKEIKSLIQAILYCQRILQLKDNEDKAKQIVANLLALANKTNESEVWENFIFSELAKFGCEELQISCCNYGRYYTDFCSKRVREYNSMLDNFEKWWAGNFISEDDKKRIATMADCVDDNVFVACKCDEEFMWFDFKFLEANGLFKISISLYKRYVDIFSYVIDKRFIVVFILELLSSKLIEFVPDGDRKELSDVLNIGVVNSPIRKFLSLG